MTSPAQMTVPTIFETCQPRPDVLAGITDADFAADLAQVVTGAGSEEYRNPVRFFANTYPTRGLKNLLGNVCRRLSGAGGDVASIFRLDTSYGGGKTHGLIALSHAARGLGGVANPSEFVEPAVLAAAKKNLEATCELTFKDGFPTTGDEPDRLTERLARFVSGVALVSATAMP